MALGRLAKRYEKEIKMDIKPLPRLTKTLCMLLKVNIAITVLAVAAGFYDYYSYANLPPEVDPSETMLPSDIAVAIVGLVQTILLIIVGITFLRWIYRTNKNLHALSGQHMRFSPGWSVGWYFIPIANLFKPYQAMREIWQVSHKNEPATDSIVGWWWFLWIVSTFVGQLAFKLVMRADSAEDYVTSAFTYIASDGIDVILNIVALNIVTQIGMAYSKNFVEQGTALDADSAALHPGQ